MCSSDLYFWLHWVFVAVRWLSLVAVSRGYSSLRCAGFSLLWLLLLRSTGSRRAGFSSCGTWAQQLWLVGSRAQAQQLWCTGLAAPWHVGSSQTRARTRIPCLGRQILNHCATRAVLSASSLDHSTCCQFPQCAVFLSLVIFHMLFLLPGIPLSYPHP